MRYVIICSFALASALLSACSEEASPIRDGATTDQRADTPPSADVGPREGSVDAPSRDGAKPDGPPPIPDECANAAPEWIFCSAFEEGDKSIWDDYDGNPDETNLLMEDPGPFELEDNHVMRLRVPEGRGGADLVKMLPSQRDKLYARWYIQWEEGYDFSAPNHGGGFHAGDRNFLGRSDYRPEGDDYFGAWVEPIDTRRLNIYSYYRGMYMDCADPNGSCWGDHFPCMAGDNYCTNPDHNPGTLPPQMEAGRWYCIELMADGGTPSADGSGATGALNFWVDGQSIGPWEGLWMRTSADLELSILWLNLFHHGDHSVEGVMFDNVVVSTERVGCL